MATAYISHRDCLAHDTGPDHPESALRLSTIEDRLIATGLFDLVRHIEAPEVTEEQLLRVHSAGHLKLIQDMLPGAGYSRLDPDTVISPETLPAALRAAGAVVAAVDSIMSGIVGNAFCCVRPPGHHAERTCAMGFCLYNNIAVGAAHALAVHGLERVAIVDFDVHQANGTEDIFRDDPRVLICSSFQHPFFPFRPLAENNDHMVSIALDASARSEEFRAVVSDHWLPALDRFRPQMIFISAGFDAHRDDDMSSVSLTDSDFQWVTKQIVNMADRFADGRIVSVLEGGYELHSLARCVEAHLRILM